MRLLASILLVTVIAAGAPVATAGPAETATANGTVTPTETATPDNATMVGSVGPVVDVLDFEFSDGTMTIWIEAKTITTVTLSQQVEDPSRGAQSFDIKQVTVSPGQNRLQLDARHVSITTSQSVEQGTGLLVSAGSTGGNPFSRLTPTTALILGGLIVGAWMVVGGIMTVRGEGNQPVKANA
jgi:hypothetical protein